MVDDGFWAWKTCLARAGIRRRSKPFGVHSSSALGLLDVVGYY